MILPASQGDESDERGNRVGREKERSAERDETKWVGIGVGLLRPGERERGEGGVLIVFI